jgi:hypothetical protein
MKNRPEFIGIGVMKAATTWVWHQLNAHPGVKMPFQKELHYFDQLNTTPEHYLRRFESVPEKYKTGEITPSYLNVPHAPILAHRLCPKSKILVVLRNPVDRAFSHWKVALWTEGKIPHNTSFISAFEQGHPWGEYWFSIKERGLYVKYLKRWYNEYPENQIKIMWYEDIEKQPEVVVKDLYGWLELDTTFLSKYYNKKFNENWSKRNPEFKVEDRKRVLEFYLPSIEKLEKFTGKDLTHWRTG